MPKHKKVNLVFQGGSVKGTAYLGALEVLEQEIDAAEVKRVAGTSAGAITAALVALGCSYERAMELLDDLDFKKTLDDKGFNTSRMLLKSIDKHQQGHSLFVSKVPGKAVKKPIAHRLAQEYGIYEGEYLRSWIENVISEQVKELTQDEVDGKLLTFAELHALTERYPGKFRDLYVVGANLSRGRKEVFSWDNPATANVIISDAIRISTSIPYVYKPHHVYYKVDGERRIETRRDIWVDGGIYDNYPIDLFDDPRYLEDGEELLAAEDGRPYNPQTLGFRLVSSERRDYLLGVGDAEPENEASSLLAFTSLMVRTNFDLQEERYSRQEHKDRTVYIDHLNISTLAFNLSEEQKKQLIESGRQATTSYLEEKASEIELRTDTTVPVA